MEGTRLSELVITRGYPASGKTTWAYGWAEEPGRVKAPSRDDLRMSLFRKEYCNDQEEKIVTSVQKAAVKRLLDDGYSVIVDDTNLNKATARSFANLAEDYGIRFTCANFYVDTEECKRRNQARKAAGGRFVPPDVIDRMARKSPMKDWKPVEPSYRLDIQPYVPPEGIAVESAYIFDIDGTVAHMTGRSPYDYTRVGEDAADREVRELFWTIQAANLYARMIFVSGRKDDCRDVTEAWLKANGFEYDWLYMRKTGDDRNDAVVKLDIFNEHIRNGYDVLGVFDDRNRVVNMWRRLGLKCFQVAEGDF
jgi:predicted kinase